jgi:sugar lactone lactonase YvrE
MLLSSCIRLGLVLLLGQLPEGPMIASPVGTGRPGYAGDGGLAVEALLNGPFDVDFDGAGNLYVSDTSNHRIRRVDIRTGIITTVAGDGTAGFGGDGGPAIRASLDEPYGLVIDRLGNLYFADRLNRRVRRVEIKTGLITTVAGDGSRAFSGDGGPAPEAGLVEPNGVAIDARGRLYIADVGDNRVRVVDPATGRIETFAGTGRRRHDGDGGSARAASIAGARAVAVAPDGTIYILEREGNTLRAVAPGSGRITTVAGTGTAGYSGDGGPARSATFNGPKELAVDADGHVFIADTENHAIRRIDAKTGLITTIAGDGTRGGTGDGGPATAARLDRPHGVGIGLDSSISIGDTGNHRIRKITP